MNQPANSSAHDVLNRIVTLRSSLINRLESHHVFACGGEECWSESGIAPGRGGVSIVTTSVGKDEAWFQQQHDLEEDFQCICHVGEHGRW